ncbi:metallophosphoesterase family protein [Prosthecomicrobium pneumaticum]|uniref:Serine/threonine protein phosphatase 1 n=1 Tax=Prosthecomicrobium pneumaticum TaxID=81895 RepID=A0A7W9CW48_9HYPH|nr:metallophosphoesterase family protein [Prosthecomicrobium pneumaticum]MBB5752656.1 serine/threonine protein phosphatase 1 [Prosthecomicrobium pneumaticum]
MLGAIRRGFGLARRIGVPERRLSILRPEADLVYAIGDVHGCLDQLIALEAMIAADAAALSAERRLIVLLGDLVDRGPASAGVIGHLLAPPPAGFERLVLRGNHELAFLAFLDAPERTAFWLTQGGMETLASYGLSPGSRFAGAGLRGLAAAAQSVIPAEHIAFLRGLPVAALWDGFVLVHAGLRPGVPIEAQSERDLTEIREPFLSATEPLGAVVVHGHTPQREPSFDGRRIGIDLGCFATGRLCAVRLGDGPPRFLVAE